MQGVQPGAKRPPPAPPRRPAPRYPNMPASPDPRPMPPSLPPAPPLRSNPAPLPLLSVYLDQGGSPLDGQLRLGWSVPSSAANSSSSSGGSAGAGAGTGSVGGFAALANKQQPAAGSPPSASASSPPTTTAWTAPSVVMCEASGDEVAQVACRQLGLPWRGARVALYKQEVQAGWGDIVWRPGSAYV